MLSKYSPHSSHGRRELSLAAVTDYCVYCYNILCH